MVTVTLSHASDIKDTVMKNCKAKTTEDAALLIKYAAAVEEPSDIYDEVEDGYVDVDENEVRAFSGLAGLLPGGKGTSFAEIIGNGGVVNSGSYVHAIMYGIGDRWGDKDKDKGDGDTGDKETESEDKEVVTVMDGVTEQPTLEMIEKAECNRDLDHFLSPILSAIKCTVLSVVDSSIKMLDLREMVENSRPAFPVETWALKSKSFTLQWRHNVRAGVSNSQPGDCLLNRLFRRRSKKTSKLRVTGLCEGNLPVTNEFPAQRASNAENVSIWWRHHE